MTKSCVFSLGNKLIIRVFTLLILVFIPLALAGQKPADFSGTWTQDNSKGNDILKGYNLTLTITQTDKTITITHTFINDKGKEEDSQLTTYNLDGKEVVKKEPQWVTGTTASWSADRKDITIKTTQTLGSQVVESYEIYSLAENGQILTRKRYNAEAKDHILTSVFNKKK